MQRDVRFARLSACLSRRAVAALGAVWLAPVAANSQQPQPPGSSDTLPSISEQKLDAVAAALRDVADIKDSYQQKIEQAPARRPQAPRRRGEFSAGAGDPKQGPVGRGIQLDPRRGAERSCGSRKAPAANPAFGEVVEAGRRPGEIRDALGEAGRHDKRFVLMRVRPGDATRFVAVPADS